MTDNDAHSSPCNKTEHHHNPVTRERTFWWHLHRMSGVIIIFLLGFHVFFVMAEKGATIGSIQQRAAQLSYVFVDIIMLLIVLFHAFNGLRIILHGILVTWHAHQHPEVNNEKRLEHWKKLVTATLITCGVILALYGTIFMVQLSIKASP